MPLISLKLHLLSSESFELVIYLNKFLIHSQDDKALLFGKNPLGVTSLERKIEGWIQAIYGVRYHREVIIRQGRLCYISRWKFMFGGAPSWARESIIYLQNGIYPELRKVRASLRSENISYPLQGRKMIKPLKKNPPINDNQR